MIELRTTGGLPHRGGDLYEKARHERSLQLTLTSDTTFLLPPEVVGVVVDVKRHNEAFNVELVLTDAGHEEHGDHRSSTA
jgi:hypothetical protein